MLLTFGCQIIDAAVHHSYLKVWGWSRSKGAVCVCKVIICYRTLMDIWVSRRLACVSGVEWTPVWLLCLWFGRLDGQNMRLENVNQHFIDLIVNQSITLDLVLVTFTWSHLNLKYGWIIFFCFVFLAVLPKSIICVCFLFQPVSNYFTVFVRITCGGTSVHHRHTQKGFWCCAYWLILKCIIFLSFPFHVNTAPTQSMLQCSL